MFGPKRPLKPMRKDNICRTSCRLHNIPSLKIIINVERAFGIPTRNDEHNGLTRKNSNISSTAQCKFLW